MRKKTIRFLWISLLTLALLCVAVFYWLTQVMVRQSDQTLNEVANMYMEEINAQLQGHFDALVEVQLAQVEGITLAVPPDTVDKLDEEVVEDLSASGLSREFSYLALYNTDGKADILYGEPVTIREEKSFLRSLNQAEPKVVLGDTASGEVMLLLGISVGYPVSQGYPMRDGSQCTALLAGIPVEKVNNSLSLNVNNNLVFSHIIETNGRFVVKNIDDDAENYYDWLLESYTFDESDGDTVVAQMKEKLDHGEMFSMVITLEGKQMHVYCSPLSNSEWYLITVMPYGALDEAVANLGSQRIETTIIGCGILLVATLIVFFIYFRMSRRQMNEIEQAKKEAEKAQKEAVQANLAKSEFLSNMSHDIRTPMNAIVGMTAIASANIDNREQVVSCLRKISLSSKHLLGLINDVLDMSKIESGKLNLNIELICLKETAESIVTIIQPQVKAKKQKFDIFIDNICREKLYCDGVRLNQVLLNLLSNAVKFTPEGGCITMTVSQENSPKGEGYVRTHFIVQDTGIGMSEEFQKVIFDSFAREDNSRVHRTEGTGLGMAITKYIVDKMEGTITVESQKEKGSTFHVTLDLETAFEQENGMLLPPWDMLIVDDDEQLCKSTAASLEEIGIHAEWTLSGVEAIKMAQERNAQNRNYHVILLDWKIPGMDGIETARQLRRTIGNQVPILLISAYDWSDIEEEARQAGISGFIAKPLFKSTLYHGLSRLVQKEKVHEKVQEEIPDFTGVRILLAEDNEINWEVANELLSAQGFQLDWAENGQECLEKFQQSVPGTYQAILMDIRMPVLDGYGASLAIRKLERQDAKKIPIIAMTADAFSEDIQKCLDCGMNAHVAKPIDMRKLLRLLQKEISDN